MTTAEVDRLVKELAPCFALAPSLAASIGHEEAALVRLTAEQCEVIDAMAEIPRLGIKGGAGTSLGSLGLHPATLSFNCRNTAQIARYAYGLVGAAPKLRPGMPEGAAVTVEHIASEAEMVDAVRKTLHRLVTGGLPSSRIMVLSPLGTTKSALWKAWTLGNLRLVECPAAPGPNQVPFATLQRFKGLEADAVVLCDVDRSHVNIKGEHLYVAASRAKHVLVVIEMS